MVVATYKNRHGHVNCVKVDNLVNRGEWWGETYLIEVGMGYSSLFFVVEAGNEQDALDTFADSKYSHLIDVDHDGIEYDIEYCYAGNDGHAVDLDYVAIHKCKVNYFAPKNSL